MVLLPTLDGPFPERNMRHGIAYSANRVPVEYILCYDPATNERCNLEALSIDRRESRDIGQMGIESCEFGEPILTAV